MTTAAVPVTEARAKDRGITPWRAFAAKPEDWFSADEIAKAKTYLAPIKRNRIISGTITSLVALALFAAHVPAHLLTGLGVHNWVLGVVVELAGLAVFSTVMGLPLAAWRALSYDKTWGFSTTSVSTFVSDQLKGLPLNVAILSLLFIPLWAIVRATETWWVWGFVVFFGFAGLLGLLFPVVIAPLFNKYTPLEDEELRGKLLAMAKTANADVSEILVEDSSKRDTRDNAYVAGIGKTRRVVLFDTMLDKPHEHLVSVICHEIGHWKLRHLLRTLPVAAAAAFVNFAALKVLFDQEAVLRFSGVAKTGGMHNPAAIPLFLVLFGILAKATGLATSWLSRSHERQADIYALELTGDWQNLQAALRNLHTDNLADLVPGLWNRLTRSHPPAAERLAMCQAFGTGAGRSA